MSQSSDVEVLYLNHASVKISYKDFRLFCDPWLEGDCYDNGWRLQFDTSQVYELLKDCTHLWISHPHADHMHVGTLKKLAKINPEITVLTNVSATYDIQGFLKSLGFRKFVSLYERKELRLSPEISLTLYPVSAIDGALFLKLGQLRILNFNDCYPPSTALKILAKKFGKIDLLLSSYNHAGKCLVAGSAAQVMNYQREALIRKLEILRPQWFIPYASNHFYCSPFSFAQNESLMSNQDAADEYSTGLGLNPLDRVVLKPDGDASVTRASLPPQRNPGVAMDYPTTVEWERLLVAAEKFRKKMRQHFFYLTFWLKPLWIKVHDQKRILKFDINRSITEDPAADTHVSMESHSQVLLNWFEKPYGADSFCIGAHYSNQGENQDSLQQITLMSQMMTNGISPLFVVRMLLKFQIFSFLFNRREEVLALLSDFKFHTARLLKKAPTG